MSGRTKKVEVKLSESEYDALKGKASKSGLSASAFVRMAIDGAEIHEAPSADVPQLIREVRRIGNSINQILMIARTKKTLNVSELEKTLEDNRAVENLIASAYKRPWL